MAPRTISRGAKSPPIASTAMRISGAASARPAFGRGVRLHRHHLAAVVVAAGRADVVGAASARGNALHSTSGGALIARCARRSPWRAFETFRLGTPTRDSWCLIQWGRRSIAGRPPDGDERAGAQSSRSRKRASAGQPRIELVGGVRQWCAVQPRAAPGAEARAIRAAQRVHRLRQRELVVETGVRSISWWASMASAAGSSAVAAAAAAPRSGSTLGRNSSASCGC